MKFTHFTIACLLSTNAFADPEPMPSLAIDAGLWASTIAMERFWYLPNGQKIFFSDGLDHSVRTNIHTSSDTNYYNNAESRWRKFSDIGITGLVTSSFAQPLFEIGANRTKALFISRAFAINNFTSTLLKYAIHRSRPKPSRYSEIPQSGDDAKSFPSGHASNAFVAATSFALINPDTSIWIRSSVYGLAASVALARVIADRHNFTDVTVGALLGYVITQWTFAGFEQRPFEISATPNEISITYQF